MPQITNLNVAPYYDDFNEDDQFHRVLFRPGYAIQARELTTLQSILQSQIERHGKHMFVEGTVVIQAKYLIQIKLQQYNLHLLLLEKQLYQVNSIMQLHQ